MKKGLSYIKRIIVCFAVVSMIVGGGLVTAYADNYFNDEQYSSQWWIPYMGLESAWPKVTSTQEVVVAIIDTGIDYDHEDLQGRIWTNNDEIPGNGIDDDNNGYIDDYYGWDFFNNDPTVYSSFGQGEYKKANSLDNDDHGTHIAGIIGAVANNEKGIAGIVGNANVKFMILKTYGSYNGRASSENVIKAIKYAEANGATIANASWEISGNDKKLERAIMESDIFFVAAAGNNKSNIDQNKVYPACYSSCNLVSVTAINENNQFANNYANYGIKYVDLAAAGTNINSTIVGSYGKLTGTSMATPMVTGTAILCKLANPGLTSKQLKNILLNSSTNNDTLYGRTKKSSTVNAAAAVDMALATVCTKDTKKPSIKCKIKRKTNSVKCTLTVKDNGDSGIKLIRYAVGKKKASYFKKGKKGKYIISGTTLKYENNKKITFYALDRAGNQMVKTVKLKLKG